MTFLFGNVSGYRVIYSLLAPFLTPQISTREIKCQHGKTQSSFCNIVIMVAILKFWMKWKRSAIRSFWKFHEWQINYISVASLQNVTKNRKQVIIWFAFCFIFSITENLLVFHHDLDFYRKTIGQSSLPYRRSGRHASLFSIQFFQKAGARIAYLRLQFEIMITGNEDRHFYKLFDAIQIAEMQL